MDELNPGLRSYGKVVYAFGTLPILGYFIICVKVLGYSSSVPNSGVGGVLDRTPWNEFFTDTKVRPSVEQFESLVLANMYRVNRYNCIVETRDMSCLLPPLLYPTVHSLKQNKNNSKRKEPDRDLLT